MEPSGASVVNPPWSLPEFFTEEGLRQAQEYYFQTHATHARLIAEGRNAQGLAKSFVRRKLERQMGEDFKMYTGSSIGQSAQSAESMGIRGELNQILKHIYTSISPDLPIQSTIQEDLTILRHPHGALNVCYAMVHYYTGLMKSYASLAGNKRQVLKSIMDEELFKWVWRLTIAYLLSDQERRIYTGESWLCVGLRYVPRERQQSTMAQQLMEIGMFLLGKWLQESHLRFPLSYYYVVFLRQVQSSILSYGDRSQADAAFAAIASHRPGEPVDDVLVAVDVLMNSSGASAQSFDDVLRDEERQLPQFIPDQELEFIHQYDEYVDPKRVTRVLKRLLPDPRVEESSAKASLMPLLLVLRILPSAALDLVLYKLPGPMLIMVRNRIINSTMDDVSKSLLERIKEMMEVRRKRGEAYTISSRTKGTVEIQGARVPGTGAPEESSPRAAHPPRPDPLDERLILAWRLEGARINVISVSAREVLQLLGAEARVVTAWVLVALKTGQVLHVPPEQVSKEVVKEHVTRLIGSLPDDHVPRLGQADRGSLVQSTQGASPIKVLQAVLKVGRFGPVVREAGSLTPHFEGLAAKLGDQLGDFLRRPGHEDFREVRTTLTPAEKQAVGILQRVARAQ